jgi:hypothetical protein
MRTSENSTSEHVEMTFGDDALMMRPVDHPLRRWMASLPK